MESMVSNQLRENHWSVLIKYVHLNKNMGEACFIQL